MRTSVWKMKKIYIIPDTLSFNECQNETVDPKSNQRRVKFVPGLECQEKWQI